MKKLLLKALLLLAVCSSCNNDDDCGTPAPAANVIDEVHPQLANLKKPEIILNDVAKGEFINGNINNIYFQNFNDTPKNWIFTMVPGSNKISEMIYFDNNTCENSEYTYYYNGSGYIDKVKWVRTNHCHDFVATWFYTYNYEDDVLINIMGESFLTDNSQVNTLVFKCENHFSYNADGTIAEIYANFRPHYEPLSGYEKFTYTYGSNGNITEVLMESYWSSAQNKRYTYQYDSNPNPVKGLFINTMILAQLPGYDYEGSIGPNFLSNNCMKSCHSEYVSGTGLPQNNIFDSSAGNGRVDNFGNSPAEEYWFRNYVTYFQ